MPVTREVSQPERSREASDEHPKNMSPMFVTCDVSQPERSRDRSDEHAKNMSPMFVTCEVSRPERSRASIAYRPPKR